MARWRNRHALDALIADLTAKREPYELMEALQKRKVCAGVVQDASDVLRRDPQLAHRQHWVYLDHAEMGPTVYSALPCKLSRTPGYPRMPAPLLGEHTEECLRDRLALDAEEIAILRTDGVLT